MIVVTHNLRVFVYVLPLYSTVHFYLCFFLMLFLLEPVPFVVTLAVDGSAGPFLPLLGQLLAGAPFL